MKFPRVPLNSTTGLVMYTCYFRLFSMSEFREGLNQKFDSQYLTGNLSSWYDTVFCKEIGFNYRIQEGKLPRVDRSS
jgi:hypothetical protein